MEYTCFSKQGGYGPKKCKNLYLDRQENVPEERGNRFSFFCQYSRRDYFFKTIKKKQKFVKLKLDKLCFLFFILQHHIFCNFQPWQRTRFGTLRQGPEGCMTYCWLLFKSPISQDLEWTFATLRLLPFSSSHHCDHCWSTLSCASL